jgi:hypothetical protein
VALLALLGEDAEQSAKEHGLEAAKMSVSGLGNRLAAG